MKKAGIDMAFGIGTLESQLLRECPGASRWFVESVSAACRCLFEDVDASGQPQDQTVPVDTQNVVNSDAADTIPAQLKTAQTTAKQVEVEQQKLDALKKTAEEQVQNLRDTLAVASNDTQEPQENANGQA